MRASKQETSSPRSSSSSLSSSSFDPYWFQEFTFNVDDLEAELHISLWNRDRISDIFLGRVVISVSTVFAAHKQVLPSLWYPLQDRSSRKSKSLVTGESKSFVAPSSGFYVHVIFSVRPSFDVNYHHFISLYICCNAKCVLIIGCYLSSFSLL